MEAIAVLVALYSNTIWLHKKLSGKKRMSMALIAWLSLQMAKQCICLLVSYLATENGISLIQELAMREESSTLAPGLTIPLSVSMASMSIWGADILTI